ncbi:MAG: adenylosuccinate synthase, partial [Candidatus Dadabacteria bacterium]
AGHTLVVNGTTTKLSVIPSGVLRESAHGLIGAGVVLNPWVFESEVQELRDRGVHLTPKRLTIDRSSHLILDYHIAIDKARERARGDSKIGTTGRGIGPAYEDRAHRTGVAVAELCDLKTLKIKLQKVVAEKNLYLSRVLGSDEEVSFDALWGRLERVAEVIVPFIGDVSHIINRAVVQEKKVVFEGAQGTLLDQTFGTLPYVTSSNTIAGAITTGCGIGPHCINYVLGVAKAYCSRVGAGPFPTELKGEMGDLLRDKGNEYGTVTNRPRRCGWFDCVAMKRSVGLNGLNSLAITKLDVLSGIEKLHICVAYKLDGRECVDFPALVQDLERVEPVYMSLNGWEEDISSAHKWQDLPANARLYLSTISEIIGVPISLVSVGAERRCTILSKSARYISNFME